MINSEFKISKFLKLVIEVLFYSILITAIHIFKTKIPFGIQDILIAIFPITVGTWWFISTYLIMYLLSPYINKLLHSLSKDEFKRLLMILLIIFSVIPTIYNNAYVNYSNLIGFFMLYAIAAYIRLYGCKLEKLKSHTLLLLAFLIIVFNVFLAFYFIRTYEVNGKFVNYSDLYAIPKLNTILISLLTFIGFKNLNIKPSKVINTIGLTTFGVYFIHESQIIKRFLWIKLFHNPDLIENNLLPLIAIGEVIFVFLICSVIEYWRIILIEPLYMKIIKEKFDKKEKTSDPK